MTSIQAPSRFVLVSPDNGRDIDYLYTTSKNLDLRRYKGLRIIVTGEESLDERWGNTPDHYDPEDPGRGVMAPANLIDGRAIARQLQVELVQRIAALKARGVQPGLAFVRVGEDPASKVYVGRKEKTCAELGIFSETHVLPEAAERGRAAGAAGPAECGPAPARDSGAGPAAVPNPCGGRLCHCAAGEGRGRVSPGQRGQADAGRPDGLPAVHAGGDTGAAGAVGGQDSPGRKSWCWGAATSWASRWPRCCARRRSTPMPR